MKKLHRVIKFNQKVWLKSKNDFKKDFFKLLNHAVFRKTMKNVRNHRDVYLVTTDTRRNYLVSKPNYRTTKHFSNNLLATEMKRTYTLMNSPVFLGLSILEIRKIVMYEF